MHVVTVLATVLALGALRADIVTNDYFGDISSPTTLRGVTNIIAKTQNVNITADLTLDDRTFLWLKGDSGTGYVNLAPTAAAATLTVQGKSGFFTAYRYSGDGNNANTAWGKVGIDTLTKDTPLGIYRMRIGTPNGAPGSTGSGKIVVKTSPAFGYNAYGGVWARYLYVETSPKPDPETGYLDILDIADGAVADISHIENKSTVNPARILFRGGTLVRNNATSVDSPLAPATGATLVLWGVDGAEIKLKKQFQAASFTARKGTVRIVGKDLRLTNSGFYPKGTSGENFQPWRFNSTDHLDWQLTGNVILNENAFIQTECDDVLPHGPGTGHVVIGYNSGVKQANLATQIPYSCLDLYGTVQHLNGVTSSGAGFQIGIVTNTHASADATLVLGAQDVSASLNAKCTARVAVVKEGTGMLSVTDTTAESLTMSSGLATFAGTCAFTNLTVAAGVTLEGTTTVLSGLEVGAGCMMDAMSFDLGAVATMSVDGDARVFSMTWGGAEVAAGVYPAATTDWLESGTVTVLRTRGEAVADIAWTGVGDTASASVTANWSDGQGAFTLPRGRPVFATGGAQAVLDSGLSHFMGLKFEAPGDFTVVTNGPADAVNLYDSVTVTRPPAESPTVAHTYTLAAPVKLCASQTITLATNMTVNLFGGVTSTPAFGLTFSGVKQSDMSMDYADSGRLVVENARVSGPIVHKTGGGWLVLRGDVGNPGDTSSLALHYNNYRNGKNTNDGLMFGGLTRIENVTIWKPVAISGQGQVGGISDRWFIGSANTTNTFKELVECGPSTALSGEANTMMVFEKGVKVTGGSFNPRTMDASKPATFIFNGPVQLDATHRQFNPSSASRLVFNSGGNYSRLCFQSNGSTSWINVEDAFEDTGFVMDSTGGRLELGTLHQKMAWLISGTVSTTNANHWHADNYAMYKRGTIHGEYPSAVEITCGAPSESACVVTNCGVQFSGWVKLEKSGAGWHRMLSQTYQSYGDVEVSGGTLAFDSGATWRNGTNVTVKGTGTLKLGSGGTFQDACNFAAEGDDWTLDLTGTQKAFQFTVDGRKMPGGTYGATELSASHPLKGRFAGTGVLLVRAVGTTVIFR